MKSFPKYEDAKAWALAQARGSLVAYGIEHNRYCGWRVFMLPGKQYRQGFELRCEAVEPW